MKRISHKTPLDGSTEGAFSDIEDQLNDNVNVTGEFLVNNIEIATGDFAIDPISGNNIFDRNRNYDEKIVKTTTLNGNSSTDELPYNDTIQLMNFHTMTLLQR